MKDFVFATCPPLATLELAFTRGEYCVKPQLDQPLTAGPDMAKLFALCCTADTYLERLVKFRKGQGYADRRILDEIEAYCRQVNASKSVQEVLSDLQILQFFPNLSQVFGLKSNGNSTEPQLGSSYLLYVSLMNQVVMMSHQLYQDAGVPQHHKYAAHQIALLYQSLNMLQGETKPIRRQIEERFEEIKQITESKRPVLPMEMCSWMQEITSICREEVQACPHYMHKRLEPTTQLIKGRHRW